MKLDITSQDIKDGDPARRERPCDLRVIYNCPVTLALIRALQNTPCPDGCGQKCVSIGNYIGIGWPYPVKTVPIPEPLAEWMRRWDSGKKIGPASFEIPDL